MNGDWGGFFGDAYSCRFCFFSLLLDVFHKFLLRNESSNVPTVLNNPWFLVQQCVRESEVRFLDVYLLSFQFRPPFFPFSFLKFGRLIFHWWIIPIYFEKVKLKKCGLARMSASPCILVLMYGERRDKSLLSPRCGSALGRFFGVLFLSRCARTMVVVSFRIELLCEVIRLARTASLKSMI